MCNCQPDVSMHKACLRPSLNTSLEFDTLHHIIVCVSAIQLRVRRAVQQVAGYHSILTNVFKCELEGFCGLISMGPGILVDLSLLHI